MMMMMMSALNEKKSCAVWNLKSLSLSLSLSSLSLSLSLSSLLSSDLSSSANDRAQIFFAVSVDERSLSDATGHSMPFSGLLTVVGPHAFRSHKEERHPHSLFISFFFVEHKTNRQLMSCACACVVDVDDDVVVIDSNQRFMKILLASVTVFFFFFSHFQFPFSQSPGASCFFCSWSALELTNWSLRMCT